MKRRIAIFAAVFVLAAGVAGNFAIGRSAPVPAPTADVVLLRCTQTANEEVGIAQTDSSFGAPVFTDNTSCAAALSSLIKKGFRFQAVHGDDVFLYTMVKP